MVTGLPRQQYDIPHELGEKVTQFLQHQYAVAWINLPRNPSSLFCCVVAMLG